MTLTWLEPDRLCASAYPYPDDLRAAGRAGVTTVINLDEQPHAEAALGRAGIAQLHLPVVDFQPPAAAQLAAGVAAIDAAIAAGGAALVHCRYGVGRTGTLLACWYVTQGLDPDAAIARVRAARRGSVETAAQVESVANFARRL